MKKVCVILACLALTGCGLELLTTTAIQSDLQAEQLKAVRGQVANVAESTGRINLKRAIDLYQAEKGKYPASLNELVPGYFESVPTHADGRPYGYDPATGMLLDSPGQVPAGPTPNDYQKMNQIRGAINQYGMAVGYYPPSLAALVPTYLQAVPKTDSGEDFLFNPANGDLRHPAASAPAPNALPQVPRPAGGGTGAMGEAMTGIGIQNQLNGMGNSGANSAGTNARRSIGGTAGNHNAQQEKAMDALGL